MSLCSSDFPSGPSEMSPKDWAEAVSLLARPWLIVQGEFLLKTSEPMQEAHAEALRKLLAPRFRFVVLSGSGGREVCIKKCNGVSHTPAPSAEVG